MQNAIPILEKNLAAFTGAPYAVATDCCTHALELCLRLDKVKKLSSTCYTYLSVPMTFVKLGIKFTLVDEKWLGEYNLKDDYDVLVVDFHGEITSEKNAIGHFFDGHATLVVGTHTHIPTNDARILNHGTGYQTDAGMCGDYDSVIGMDKENSLNRFIVNVNSNSKINIIEDFID